MFYAPTIKKYSGHQKKSTVKSIAMVTIETNTQILAPIELETISFSLLLQTSHPPSEFHLIVWTVAIFSSLKLLQAESLPRKIPADHRATRFRFSEADIAIGWILGGWNG